MARKIKNESSVLAQNVRGMYNAHPFPNRINTLERRSDDRFSYIYKEFLHLPFMEFDHKVFLDAGCGTGENTWFWHRNLKPSNKVIAIDISHNSINIARKTNGSEEGFSPLFSIASLLDIPMPSSSVDIVFCSGVLVAVTDPKRAYSELIRILKPGGYIILVLYHRYGRALHGIRRAIINLIEPNDINRRAQLGGKLFGRSMRKLAEEEQVPYEGLLYDQFGLPCETRYSVGGILKWFNQSCIEYRGTWPPIEWSQFGKALRFSYKLAPYKNNIIFKLLERIFPTKIEAPNTPPRIITRATMEFLWGLGQLQLFAIMGQKKVCTGKNGAI
jgi:SAM-dependent methyltransferase